MTPDLYNVSDAGLGAGRPSHAGTTSAADRRKVRNRGIFRSPIKWLGLAHLGLHGRGFPDGSGPFAFSATRPRTVWAVVITGLALFMASLDNLVGSTALPPDALVEDIRAFFRDLR